MEGGDTSDQHLNASYRQIQALTANIQKLARQSVVDWQEMQVLTRQNQELIALLWPQREVQIPNPSQNGGENPWNKEEGNQNQDQNDKGSSANQNWQPRPGQVIEPTKSVADVKVVRLEEELKEMKE